MVIRSVTGSKKYFRYADCEDGEMLIENGVYLGETEGRYGIQHEFRLQDGTVVVLNSAGHLNFQLQHYVKPGQACWVVYSGKGEVPSGPLKGKMFHRFDVQIDDGLPEVEESATVVAEEIKSVKTEKAAKTEKGRAAQVVAATTSKPVVRKPKSVVKPGEDFEI
jgi:hypothetical protein